MLTWLFIIPVYLCLSILLWWAVRRILIWCDRRSRRWIAHSGYRMGSQDYDRLRPNRRRAL